MDILVCPLCRSVLELQQINLSQAVYLCLDLKCPYPIGQKCIAVEKPLEELGNSVHSRSSKKKTKKLETAKSLNVPPANGAKTKLPTDDTFKLNDFLSEALENFDLPPDNPMPVHENCVINSHNNELMLNNNGYTTNDEQIYDNQQKLNYNSEYIQPYVNHNQQMVDYNGFNNGQSQFTINDSQYMMNLEEIFDGLM